MAKDEPIYTPKEVATAVRVSQVTISRAIRDGKLKAFRVGGQWRIAGSALREYLDMETKTAMSRRDRA
jgi:excisionase family DNA binding protein